MDYLLPLTIVISAIGILQVYMAGNKHRLTWAVLLFNQYLWLVFIWRTESWGLLPVNLTYQYLAVRNHLRWKREASNN